MGEMSSLQDFESSKPIQAGRYENVLFSKINKNEICVLDIPFIKLRSDSRCYYRDITSRCNSFDAIIKRVVHIGQKNHVCITLNNDKVDQMKQSH